jgi:hypothetical protein
MSEAEKAVKREFTVLEEAVAPVVMAAHLIHGKLQSLLSHLRNNN